MSHFCPSHVEIIIVTNVSVISFSATSSSLLKWGWFWTSWAEHIVSLCRTTFVTLAPLVLLPCSPAPECGSDSRDHRYRNPGCHHLLPVSGRHTLLLEEQEQIRRGGDSQRDQVWLPFVAILFRGEGGIIANEKLPREEQTTLFSWVYWMYCLCWRQTGIVYLHACILDSVRVETTSAAFLLHLKRWNDSSVFVFPVVEWEVCQPCNHIIT